MTHPIKTAGLTVEQLFQRFDKIAADANADTNTVMQAALLVARAAIGPQGHPLLHADVDALLTKVGWKD
jgi:hypothetical protein